MLLKIFVYILNEEKISVVGLLLSEDKELSQNNVTERIKGKPEANIQMSCGAILLCRIKGKINHTHLKFFPKLIMTLKEVKIVQNSLKKSKNA